MKYTNPKPPEGINTGENRPLRELFMLGSTLFAVVAIVSVAVLRFGEWVAPHVPFSWEQALEAPFVSSFAGEGEPHPEIERALQGMADRIVAQMEMDGDITITLHYVDENKVNALATLGGHIFVYKGLLERLQTQDALAMVLAHEIAHVKNRDVLAGLTGGMVISLASSVLFGNAGVSGELVGAEAMMATLHFSRAKESRADEDAIRATVALFGHGGGAEELFEVFSSLEKELGVERKADFLTSHPLNSTRIENLRNVAAKMNWPMNGPRRPLDAMLKLN